MSVLQLVFLRMKKILWNRKLSCHHERETNIAYEFGDYKKPVIGDDCYCRECWESVKIIEVGIEK